MLSIHSRQVLASLVLPALIFFSVGLILVGQIWPQQTARLRLFATGEMAPIYKGLTFPQRVVGRWVVALEGVTDLVAENNRLREENGQLQHWYNMSISLKAENVRLKSVLHWGEEPNLTYVSGWVARDESGPYLRAVLLDIGTQYKVHSGSLVVDSSGLVGRVSEVGDRVVRVLLIEDAASRIPVSLQSSGGDAIMIGDNSPYPRLMYSVQDVHPQEGERVETRGQMGLTGGVPVGHIHYISTEHPVVVPDANLAHLEIVRVFDTAETPEEPPSVGRVRERSILLPDQEGQKPYPGWQDLRKYLPFTHVGNG